MNKLNFVTIETEHDQAESILKIPAQTVQFPLSDEDILEIAQMKEKLYELDGVGIAAPQVGISKRVAVIYIPETAALLREDVKVVPMHAIINPEYEAVDPENKNSDFEGCYSVKSHMGKVSRPHTIRLKCQDEEGKKVDKVVEGFYARVLQHEIDHLNGILCIDRLTPNCVQGDISSMMKLRRRELPEEKRKIFDELLKKKGMAIED